MKLYEMFDLRSSDDRSHGDHNYHHSIETARTAAAEITKGFWLMKSGKRLAGPFVSKERAMSFKANRTDKIPKDATVMHQ